MTFSPFTSHAARVLAICALGLSSLSAQAEDLKNIRLATTTSTYNSGLLDYLLPKFKQDSGYAVDVISVGTGKALKMGENGDVDLVITHAPEAEAQFIDSGFGVEPHYFMYNDFVVVGPKNDPAKLKQANSVTNGFKAIAQSNAGFISRGDDSGTDKKEKGIWTHINVTPNFSNYRAIGQGMSATLTMASELQAYALTDRGTWIAYQSSEQFQSNPQANLVLLLEGDEALFNPYQVILVNPTRYEGLNTKGARALSDWLISEQGQAMIDSYTLQGQTLFTASYDGKAE